MEYSKIISVTGLSGLYELVGSKTDGAIVRSLEDKNTRFVSSRIHNFSHLESIEIFTVADNVNLVDLLQAIDKSTEKLPDEKDAGAVKKYFEKVYPDMDFTRVYASDMKKMIKWFKVLKAADIEFKLREQEAEEQENESVEEVAPAEEVQPEIKKITKKAKAEPAETVAATATEEKPKKKATPKKKAE